MPTISVYMSDEDYEYYKSLENKSRVIKWCFAQHRKMVGDIEEPIITIPEETA